jgi:hypothetical protein
LATAVPQLIDRLVEAKCIDRINRRIRLPTPLESKGSGEAGDEPDVAHSVDIARREFEFEEQGMRLDPPRPSSWCSPRATVMSLS